MNHYDLILMLIPLSLGVGSVVLSMLGLTFNQSLAISSIPSIIAILDAILIDPPNKRDGTANNPSNGGRTTSLSNIT